MDGLLADAFSDSSRLFVAAVGLVPADAWERTGLGTWTVRELVAHANRAHMTLAEYVRSPQQPIPPDSKYFHPDEVARRGREASLALGSDPARAVGSASADLIELVEQNSADTLVGSPMQTTTLEQYLPSRVAELTIHSLDLLRALDMQLSIPPNALEVTLAFVARRATARSGVEVLLALTGRGELPTAYNVY